MYMNLHLLAVKNSELALSITLNKGYLWHGLTIFTLKSVLDLDN